MSVTDDAAGPNLPQVLLSELVALDLLAQNIADGFISVKPHPQDPALKILNYTQKTQFAGNWNEATKIARGLIVRSECPDFTDAVVIERPWRKFFTLSQIKDTGWALSDDETSSIEHSIADLDFTAAAEVTDKLDGSLGILYWDAEGKPAIATRGSFSSDQASLATRMVNADPVIYEACLRLRNEHPQNTYLFEIVGPSNPIVLSYDSDDLVLLGAVNKLTGQYLPADEAHAVWLDNGLTVAEQIPVTSIEEALKMPPRDNREGMVVRILSDDPTRQMMVKIKQDDYLELHRLLFSISTSVIREQINNAQFTVADLPALYAAVLAGAPAPIPGLQVLLDRLPDIPTARLLTAKINALVNEALLPELEKALNSVQFIKDLQTQYPDLFPGERAAVKKFVAEQVGKYQLPHNKNLTFKLADALIAGEDPQAYPLTLVMPSAAKQLKGLIRPEE